MNDFPATAPPAAKACLDLLCQLRDGPREDGWRRFITITASWRWDEYAGLWEWCAGRLGLELTPTAVPPTPHAVRESTCPLTNRCAWRV